MTISRLDASDNPYPPGAFTFAIRGYRERITPKSRFKVIEIDFTANPQKDSAAWLEEQRLKSGDNKVRREVLRDWTVAAGDAFYPEYANNGGRARYGFTPRGIAHGIPVDRGWDFGFRMPVVTWGQAVNGRAYVLRELLITNIDTYALADLINFLSGTIVEEEMLPNAQAEYNRLVDEGFIEPGPWFPRGVTFRDFGGPEVFARTALVRDGDPRSNDEILASKGIHISAPRVEIMDREQVTRKLLHVDVNGRPSMRVSDRCVNVHAMFNGGLAYPPPTRENPKPSKPRKDGKYDNVHDAVTYWFVQVFPLVTMVKLPTHVVYRNRVPYEVEPRVETLGFHEVRGARMKRLR